MERRRSHPVTIAALALVTTALVTTTLVTTTLATTSQASPPVANNSATTRHGVTAKATLPTGFRETTAIGGLSQPVSVAFAPDGTAFVALQTGVIKSYDYDAKTGQFEAAGSSTDFADLSAQVSNYGDRGLTGITVDPQFPARPYVYVNYTYNADPQDPDTFPAWGTPGQAYDNCGPGDADEANIPDAQHPTPQRGCPVMDRVSRLTAVKGSLGWTMAPNGEHVLVQDGCAQFSSHSSGDVVFGPDGMLYASAGEGASFLDQDYGQVNDLSYPEGAACPGDPVDEGGSLRAQDQRSSGDPLGIDGTIFRLNADTGLTPQQATAGDWLVAMGQRNPWRLTFRQGKEQLWSVDVGSSKWEEINQLVDAPSTGLVNRGWPCYEGTTGQSLVNPQWQALGKPLCTDLYNEGVNAVQAPVYAYRTTNATRTATDPITPGENCPAVSSSMSGIAFSPLGTSWPAEYQDALFFSDFLRGCIWRMGKDANGQPNPNDVHLFVQTAGSPTKLVVGPGGDLYYTDYGMVNGEVGPGAGGVHRISYAGATKLTVKSSPNKVKLKVDGKRHKAPFHAAFFAGTVVKLVAPKVYVKGGVRYAFSKWKGVTGRKAKKKHKLVLTVGYDAVTVKAVYHRVRKR